MNSSLQNSPVPTFPLVFLQTCPRPYNSPPSGKLEHGHSHHRRSNSYSYFVLSSFKLEYLGNAVAFTLWKFSLDVSFVSSRIRSIKQIFLSYISVILDLVDHLTNLNVKNHKISCQGQYKDLSKFELKHGRVGSHISKADVTFQNF